MSTSRSLNKVFLIGNLTRNPIVKNTNSSSVVATFGLATNSVWKDGNGGVQERTEFHNVVAWNKLAEICAQLLSVGMSVFIEGELRTRMWTDENGVRHYRTEVKALDMKILDSKGKKGVGFEGESIVAEGLDSATEEGAGEYDEAVVASNDGASEDDIIGSNSTTASTEANSENELENGTGSSEESGSGNNNKSKSSADISGDDLF